MINQQNVLKATLLMVLMLGLTACGASKQESSTDLASRSPNGTTDTTKAWAQCNSGTSMNGLMKVNLAAYYEGANVRNDLMYVRIANLPSDFESAGNYLQMFRWQANTSGSTYTDPTPLSFKIVNPANGAVIVQSRTSVKWTDVSTVASGMGYSDAASFFKKVWLLVDLRDPGANFDVLMTAIYLNNSTQYRDYANTLLPIFAADPAAYATDLDGSARNPALQALHPFKDKLNQGWTKADFQSWANNFCSNF